MSLNPIKWYTNLSGDTKKTLFSVILGMPSAVFYVIRIWAKVADWVSKEAPSYAVTTTPFAAARDEKFLVEAMGKLKDYKFQTTVVIENLTSEKMTQVVVVIPREGLWSLTDNKGTFTPLLSFDRRVEIEAVPAQASAVLIFWHNDQFKSGEKVLISSKEHKREVARFWEENTIGPAYYWGFWLASPALLVLVSYQVWQWWRQRHSPTAPTTTPSRSSKKPADARKKGASGKGSGAD